MFERFDDAARTALGTALTEAAGLGHDHIGTEHLLLGVVADADGVPARLTAAHGVEPDVIRHRIGLVVPPRDRGEPAYHDPGRLLASLGIDLDEVRRRAEVTFGADRIEQVLQAARTRPCGHRGRWFVRRPGRRTVPRPSLAGPSARLPLTPRTKEVLELAAREADRRRQLVTPTHQLLGILAKGEGLACLILVQAGVSLTDLTAEARAALGAAPA